MRVMQRILIKIGKWISLVFAAIGGFMSLASSLIQSASRQVVSEEQTQYWGLAFLVISILLFMLANIFEGLIKDSTEPIFSWGGVRTDNKAIRTQQKLFDANGRIVSIYNDPNVHADFDFAIINIYNNPKNRLNGHIAQNAKAEIIFDLGDGQRKTIEYGRWCDTDEPLFQPKGDTRSLKWINIEPGKPETLYFAFKRKHGNIIYAFSYLDHTKTATHEDVKKLCEERLIGKPPVNFSINIDGGFDSKKFSLILDIDDNGEFTVTEKEA